MSALDVDGGLLVVSPKGWELESVAAKDHTSGEVKEKLLLIGLKKTAVVLRNLSRGLGKLSSTSTEPRSHVLHLKIFIINYISIIIIIKFKKHQQ